jgi:hypothetical protein
MKNEPINQKGQFFNYLGGVNKNLKNFYQFFKKFEKFSYFSLAV